MNKKTIFITILAFLIGIIISFTICYLIFSREITNLEKDLSNQLGNYKKVAFDWLEDSGESESLDYQAYNTATKSLAEMIKQPSSKPKAVILDIDETCLDNGPFQGYEIKYNNSEFDYSTWDKWVNFAEAKAIPGSVQFTQEAKKTGVQVFYVSGRSPSELDATVKNLNNCGFADANEPGHVILFPPSQGGKQPTYDQIEKDYDVIMYVGDQLSDMGSQFHGTSAEQKEQVTEAQKDWGSKYISIPNPIYGNFLGGIYGSKPLNNQEQATAIDNGIQTFNPETGEIYSKK